MTRELAALILKRAPVLIEEAESAGHPRTVELYDEADDWREPLRGRTRASLLEIDIWRAAHAVVMAVSAVFFDAPGDHRESPYFMEKRGEALVALDRLRRTLYGS